VRSRENCNNGFAGCSAAAPLNSMSYCDSSVPMIRDRTLQTRARLLGKLPISGELLRGSLLRIHVDGEPCRRAGRGNSACVAKGLRQGARRQDHESLGCGSVGTNIHYPTDSSLLGYGVRVLTRTMRKIAEIASAGDPRCLSRFTPEL
jgi:hypothetical protein